MKTNLKTLATVTAVIFGAAIAPALADSQLIANAGLTPAEAQGLTLNEIAVHKFNRNADSDDRQVIVRRSGVTVASRSVNSADRSQLIANAGLTPEEAAGMTLNEIAVHKFNRDADSDNRQGIVRSSGVTVASRSVNSADRSQLIANAGLTPEEAAGMTLNEIAIAKFNRDADSDSRQGLY